MLSSDYVAPIHVANVASIHTRRVIIRVVVLPLQADHTPDTADESASMWAPLVRSAIHASQTACNRCNRCPPLNTLCRDFLVAPLPFTTSRQCGNRRGDMCTSHNSAWVCLRCRFVAPYYGTPTNQKSSTNHTPNFHACFARIMRTENHAPIPHVGKTHPTLGIPAALTRHPFTPAPRAWA